MVDRPNKPSALASTPAAPPQPTVDITHDHSRVSATLPTGESVEVLLHGANVLSWKDAAGQEKLWLSESAALDGSAPVRGGIPIVFPVFGTAPDHEATSKLPQHGFARNSRWEFLGRSTSEGSSSSVKLDFGLSSENLAEDVKALWPYKFNLIYSVSLDPESLSTTLVVTNDGDVPFDFQTLLHSYFKIDDISSTDVSGLEDSEYIDKLANQAVVTQSGAVAFSSETDRIYTPAKGPKHPVVISSAGKPVFRIVRDNLDQVVVWNPWVDKAASTKDFTPKDGWKHMVCVEPGSVKGWQKLEAGDAFEAAQSITLA
ncbi:galactose mutarotase-like domain-containing protein [Ilyonectria robusta]|uniref:galactose mutarotase-like domain-containing protein n=1 Tax=Ilyonectria robusta TaxID=1079257 RepID=UPI001E8EDC09|nr:galactose mutarotase-like domain-containing protein [Ilyonectria robusta]KAH6977049.1 galactose mutarotase-like domain-containing protein [Ilyonectria sp. MPI-CAGE-AT-0026]KAH8714256.1 galactose mutarotase-like domain-containing protein [Ilyonectria robusta]